jgi:predicted PurR-regulated permease PerM
LVEEISSDVRGQEDTPEVKVQTVRIQQEKGSAISLVPVLAGPIWTMLGKIGLTLALTTSMLLMREDLRNRVFLLLGEGNLTSSTKAIEDASKRISRYLITQVILNASFGALYGLGLWLIGVLCREPGGDLPHYARYALVWGVLAAVLRFIPYVGTWMAAVFPVLVGLIQPGWTQPLLVVGWCVLLGVLVNSVVEPMLVSRSTGVSPIALVVSAAFWTWLWGPIGLVLATPLTVCLSVLGKHVPSLRFLDVLLGGDAPLGPELLFYQRLLAHDQAEASDLLDEYLKDHTREELFDRLIVPALARVRADRERGHLSEEELDALVKTMHELLDEELGEAEQPAATAAPVLACPAYDAIDRLLLEMFGRVLDPAKARLNILSPDLTAAEVVELAGQEKPALVCVGLLPPDGVSRARYLCKRLRAKHPKLPIVAAVWGASDPGELGVQLIAAGASEVVGSLAAARAAVVPLALVASQLSEATANLEPVGQR